MCFCLNGALEFIHIHIYIFFLVCFIFLHQPNKIHLVTSQLLVEFFFLSIEKSWVKNIRNKCFHVEWRNKPSINRSFHSIGMMLLLFLFVYFSFDVFCMQLGWVSLQIAIGIAAIDEEMWLNRKKLNLFIKAKVIFSGNWLPVLFISYSQLHGVWNIWTLPNELDHICRIGWYNSTPNTRHIRFSGIFDVRFSLDICFRCFLLQFSK